MSKPNLFFSLPSGIPFDLSDCEILDYLTHRDGTRLVHVQPHGYDDEFLTIVLADLAVTA